MPATRAATASVGRSFELRPRQLRAASFGASLPAPNQIFEGAEGRRQLILLETLAKLEEASPTARYHALALRNLQRWAEHCDGTQAHAPGARCKVHVR